MQSVSSSFTQATQSPIRLLNYRCLASFLKNFDEDTTFFTIGESLIGGPDIIKGDGSVVQEWDKYDYDDYTGRVLDIEWNREAEPPLSAVTMATADITFNNTDDYFTPTNENSPIYGNIKPRRPIRLYVGFDQGVIPIFIGVTDGMPVIDEKNKTARFHCIDFLQSIMNIPLDTEVMYIDKRTDEIVASLLETAGLVSSQFDLDTGSVIVPFAYFKKDSKIGDALREIAEAELGTLYMREDGVIRFENRTNWASNEQVWGLDQSQVLDMSVPNRDSVINLVEVFAKAREVQAKQKLWELANPIEIGPNGTVEIFADFKDDYGDLPVTSVDDPDYITSATTSLYATNEKRDGSGPTMAGDVSLDSTDQFSTAFKMTFSNSNATKTVFITQLELYATPAKVINDIYVKEIDQASIGNNKDGVDEKPYQIENNYIQDSAAATTMAKIILEDRAEIDDQRSMLIKGIPQLQVGDVLHYTDRRASETYYVTKISGTLNSSGLRQNIMVSKRTIREYFRIGISTIGGSDVIGP